MKHAYHWVEVWSVRGLQTVPVGDAVKWSFHPPPYAMYIHCPVLLVCVSGRGPGVALAAQSTRLVAPGAAVPSVWRSAPRDKYVTFDSLYLLTLYNFSRHVFNKLKLYNIYWIGYTQNQKIPQGVSSNHNYMRFTCAGNECMSIA